MDMPAAGAALRMFIWAAAAGEAVAREKASATWAARLLLLRRGPAGGAVPGAWRRAASELGFSWLWAAARRLGVDRALCRSCVHSPLMSPAGMRAADAVRCKERGAGALVGRGCGRTRNDGGRRRVKVKKDIGI